MPDSESISFLPPVVDVRRITKKIIIEGWKHGSSGREPAQQVQAPEFKSQYCQKIISLGEIFFLIKYESYECVVSLHEIKTCKSFQKY
jgi:hypothetical protein